MAYCDPAEGKGRDYTVTVFLEARTLVHVCTVRERVLEPGEHARQAVRLARWYNEAFFGFERAKGEAVAYVLGAEGYPRVYRHQDPFPTLAQTINGRAPAQRIGFPMTEQSRMGLIDDLAQVITDWALQSWDGDFWSECATFVVGETGKAEATVGTHDDLVLAMAGAVRMARQAGAQTLRTSGNVPVSRSYGYQELR